MLFLQVRCLSNLDQRYVSTSSSLIVVVPILKPRELCLGNKENKLHIDNVVSDDRISKVLFTQIFKCSSHSEHYCSIFIPTRIPDQHQREEKRGLLFEVKRQDR